MTASVPEPAARPSRALRRGFVAGFMLSAVLVLLITGFSILELRRAQRLEQEGIRQDRLLQTLGRLGASFERKSAMLRGYLLTGDREFLEEASAARKEFLERVDWLDRTVSEPAGGRRIARLRVSETAHEQAWASELDSMKAFPPADSRRILGRIATPRENLVRDIRSLTDHQTRMLEAVHRSAEKRLFRTALTVLAGGGAALLLTLVLTGLLARRLTDLYGQEQAARERAEDTAEALKRREKELQAVFEGSLDPMVIADDAGRFVEVNPAARELFGVPREQLLGRSIGEFAQASYPFEETWQEFRELGAARGEFRLTRPDGSIRDAEFSATADVQPGRHLSALRDVTERKDAEAALLNLERKARAAAEAAEGRSAFLAEASALLAASMDWEATLKRVSRLAVPRIADWCVVDILEDGVLAPLSVTHVDQSKVELVNEIWRRFPRDQHAEAGPAHVARTGLSELTEQISDELLRRVSRNEEHFEMVRRLRLGSSVCVPLEARGQILGALTFACEAGGRRYGPDDVAFAESLANRASLAIDNARLFRQAHEAVRLRDEFLSIASHELKTPVTTLRLQIESLMRHLPPEAEDATGPRLSTTRRQVDRLQKLIERLLDISRLTGGRLELDLEPVNLELVVREVVGRFDEELRHAGCRATVRGADPLSGRWDRSRLDQVVTNLLSNAIKYGSGQPIEITLDGDERTARLEVRDHGIGIPTDKLPRIFERFERAVSERHYGGLGLGLWIVRQIVVAFGGSVRALSAPGDGSTFIVELPRTPPTPDAR